MSPRRGDRAAYWDREAPRYDARTAGLERRVLAASRAWVCARARGETLEVAVGTGANLGYYGDDVVLTGVDWSPAMLGIARRRAAQLRPGASFRQADAGALPFASTSFDTVLATFSMCCVPDLRAALTEAVRVLRPEGRLLLADHIASSNWGLRALQHAVDLVSVPLHGEHYARRPLRTLAGLDVEVQETERLTLGAIERVHARKGRAPDDAGLVSPP